MKKMLAREDISKEKPKHVNEERFNNFSINTHRARKSLDFDCYLGRNRDSTKTARQSNPEKQVNEEKVGKAYEKCLFDQSLFRCFVDYQKNGKGQSKKAEQQLFYEPWKVARGEQLTKKNKGHLQSFYLGKGKDAPSQLDNRLLR